MSKVLNNLIQVLPEDVANKIAAGEVVERPASVAKELVENSIDAGATEIEISVKHGGLSFIRITDNGSGMTEEDAKLSVIRHATSKLSTIEDIFNIHTFGFRGEALPSIASVSQFKMKTRARGADKGFELVIEGGKITSQGAVGVREGTIIEIKDLFFNTPARRKFLKTERTEGSRLTESLSLLALANPQIRFVLSDEKKTIFDLPKNQTLRERVRSLYDSGYEQRMIDISGELAGVQITGLVGKPELAQAHRRDQIFFVNQRPVKSIALSFALKQAFHGLVMDGRFPVGILFIDVDPKAVDVNIHPTKQEVKLSNEKAIKNFLVEVIRNILLDKDLYPQITVKDKQPNQFFNPSEKPSMDEVRDSVTGFFGEEATRKLGVDASAPVLSSSFSDESQQLELSANEAKALLGEIRVLGQMHASFIIGEYSEGLVIIDQHAAHERVQFEAVLNSLIKEKTETQGLLMPVTFTLKSSEEDLFKDVLPFLAQVGFTIEPFGDRTYAVQSTPVFIQEADVEHVIKGFMERIQLAPGSSPLEHKQESVAALLACKSRSFKAKDKLQIEEMQELVKLLQQTKSPFTCPHGRPALLKFTLFELEKQFKRK